MIDFYFACKYQYMYGRVMLDDRSEKINLNVFIHH